MVFATRDGGGLGSFEGGDDERVSQLQFAREEIDRVLGDGFGAPRETRAQRPADLHASRAP